MDVTILIAPAGSGYKPVRFMPKTHVISVPDDDDLAAEAVVNSFKMSLTSRYHSQVYIWESVKATPDLMQKFRRMVLEQEEARIRDLKKGWVYQSYCTALWVTDDVYRIPVVVEEFISQIRRVFPRVSKTSARYLLSKIYDSGKAMSFTDYCSMLELYCPAMR